MSKLTCKKDCDFYDKCTISGNINPCNCGSFYDSGKKIFNDDHLEKEAWENEQENDDYHKHKFDQGKTDWSLIPVECYEAIVGKNYNYYWSSVFNFIIDQCDYPVHESLAKVREILEHGAEKYERESWKKVPDAKQRYFAAFMRHSFCDEGKALPKHHIDADSGFPSVWHALTNVIFLLWFEIQEEKNK